jgi:hypothetical protein
MEALDQQFHRLHQDGLPILTKVADATGARLVEQLATSKDNAANATSLSGFFNGDARITCCPVLGPACQTVDARPWRTSHCGYNA